jgi:preprotein translocase subunit SecD
MSASTSAMLLFTGFKPTELDGSKLKRAAVQFDQKTGEPVISIEFNEAGTKLFSDITKDNLGKMLGIYLDGSPVALPRIQAIIPNGMAQISGGFTVEEAKQLAIQLNAGALPVPISIIEQRTIGASLGKQSVRDSVQAGLIGIGLVMLFMVLIYGFKGFLASLALLVYAVLTVALYKVMGITLTLPGIAGMLLSIGMAVDANILIFERMKEELRLGKPFSRAMELGFGRAWDSIKDANLATIMTALILINPLDFSFLNTSGLVRGFGVTLLTGVLISLFTGVVVTRTLMRVFLRGGEQ